MLAVILKPILEVLLQGAFKFLEDYLQDWQRSRELKALGRAEQIAEEAADVATAKAKVDAVVHAPRNRSTLASRVRNPKG